MSIRVALVLALLGAAEAYDVMKVVWFGACKSHRVPNRMENVTIVQVSKGIVVLNGDVLVVEGGGKKLPALVTIFRCQFNSDHSCEPFLKFSQKNFCPFFVAKGEFWSVFYDSIKPKVSCPIPKGHYTFRNATIDLALLLKSLPYVPEVDNYYWKFRTQLFTEKQQELLCVAGLGKLEHLRPGKRPK